MTVRKPVKECKEAFCCSESDVEKSKEFSTSGFSWTDSGNDNSGEKLAKELSNQNCGLEKKRWKNCAELETDQESGGSSEEMESPKSVAKLGQWRNKVGYVHSQILRIREEDSHLGEDIRDGLSSIDKISTAGGSAGSCHHYHNHDHRAASPINVVIFSRAPILPSSPLRGKN